MLERTAAIRNEVLEPITFVLAYPTVHVYAEEKPLTLHSTVSIGTRLGAEISEVKFLAEANGVIFRILIPSLGPTHSPIP
jgi:hypothetical protein